MGLLKEFRLYWKYVKLHILSALEYKGWWVMFLQVVVIVIAEPIMIVLLFNRFGNIGDWTMERVLLIYAITITSYGLADSFFRGFTYFPSQVRGGDFDRILLRPKTLFTQVAVMFFHTRRLARAVVGLGIIFWALNGLGVQFSMYNAAMLVLALLGGTLTYIGIFVITAGLSIIIIEGLDWITIFTYASYETTRIPIDHMPQTLRYMFTFLMPVLVISYFPASAIVGFGGPAWRGWLALPAGVLFLSASMLVWKIGVKHYKSTGS